MAAHNADPQHVPAPTDPTLVPVAPPAAVPAEAPDAHRPEWQGGALAPPPGLASGPDAMTLLKGLQRRWWVAMGLGVLLAGGAAAAAWYFLTPKQTAVAQVHIDTTPPWIVKRNVDTPDTRNEFINYERWQAAQMKSRFVLNAARKHDEVKSLGIVRAQPDQIAWMEDEIKVDYKDGDEVLAITMLGFDAEGVKAIVNAVRDEYFKEVVEKEHKARVERKKVLEEIVGQNKTELSRMQDTLHALAKKVGTTDALVLAPQQAEMISFYNEKRRALSQVEDSLSEAKTRLKAYDEARGKDVPDSAVPAAPSPQDLEMALEADPTGHGLMLRRDQLRQRVAEWRATARDPNEPGLLADLKRLRITEDGLKQRRAEVNQAMLEALRQSVRHDADTAAVGLRTEVAALEQRRAERAAELKGLEEDKGKLGEVTTDMQRLRDEIEGEKVRLARYENDLADLSIELGPNVPQRITPYQDAMLLKTDLKKQIAATVLAPFGMLVMVCFGVAWWDCRARRIHTADEVATGLGMRVVGAVPPLPNAAQLVAAAEAEQNVHVHSLLESIDSIRTVLLRDAHVEATRVVMVTSAVGGEGKTTLASHLAGSLARAGRRTLLVDCDLRRPSVHQLFELPLQPGLSEALVGEVHIAEATLSTSVDGLWMIPAGQWDREVLQALAREGLQKVFEKLKSEYDFVVVDSHPVLPATDSLLIGQHVDAVILSVLHGVSQAPRVYAAYQRLATLGIRIFGAVVNGLPEDDIYSGSYQYATTAR
jgi:capsular exopolysaccharide synthesis family protein